MEYIALFIVGLLVGVISSFFGVGGGVIIVPTLFTFFPELNPSQVIAISLTTIVLSTAINNFHFYKAKLSPGLKSIIIFILFCSFGALSGSYLVTNLSPESVKKYFGFILLIISLRKLLQKKGAVNNNEYFKETPIIMAISALLGSFLSALTGLGGGVIYVPLFQNLAKIPTKRISAFSNMAMMIGAGLALIPHLQKSNVHFSYALIIFLGAFFTSKLGIKIDSKIPDRTKSLAFSILLLTLSLKILFF